MNDRIVKTPFYTKTACDILDSVLGQLSDGWGENNPSNEKWWRFANAETNPDGRVVIKIGGESGKSVGFGRGGWTARNGWYGMDEDGILAKFAGWVKKTMQMELKDDGVKDGWKRDNVETTTSYLKYDTDITVAQVYCVYEALLGRDVEGKYTAEIQDSVFGHKASEEEIRLETERRAEIARIEEKLAADRKTVDEWRRAEIARIEAEARKRVEKCLEEYRTAKAGVRKAVA